MKRLIIFLILLAFSVVSCGSSKKAENDADILPDEDAADTDITDDDEEESEESDDDNAPDN
ncbi:hypothetical protein J6253_07575, partial [bacterium]|nr:hypothetical protein [bacterium]